MCALGLAVLACAVLMTGLLTAGSASAQTENADGSLTLWEAEMTAASFTLSSQSCTGYQSSPAKGSLNPTTFSEGAKSWTVAAVCPITGTTFFLQFDTGSSDVADLVDSNLEFHFGSTKFTGLTDGVNTSGMLVFQIPSSGLTPSAGTAYTLKFIRKQAPTAPRNLSATGVSATRIDLSWNAPEKTGGSDVTGYKIEVSNDGNTGWSELVADTESTDTSYSHKGLPPSATRHYRVSAINKVGAGPASASASGTTAAGFTPIANAEGSLTLWEAEMTAASFTLSSQSCIGYQSDPAKGSLNPTTFSEGAKSWTVAAVCPITGATFFLQLDSGSSDVADLVDSNLEFHFGSTKFTGLTDGVNTSGMRVFQIPNSGLTPSAGTSYTLKFIRKQAPTAPRNLRAEGVSATRIDLSWSAPEKTGGSDVTGYRIEVSNDGNTGWSELVADTESTDTSYSHKGLPPSATRHYRVSAINKVGAGPASASASGTTAAGFTPIANADGSLTLWEAEMTAASFTLSSQSCIGYQSDPAKGSLNPTTFSEGAKSWTVAAVCPITGTTFFLQLDSGSSDVADLVDSNLEFHFGSTKFTGLTDGVNTSGMGVFQIPNSGLTPSAGTAYTLKFIRKQAPSAPRNLSATGVSATRIDLSWSAPEKTGGSDVTGYRIEVSNDGNTGWSELVADTESTDTSYSHKGLPPSATRHYRVSAINKVGAGPASASAAGTTAAGFTPIANADGSLTLWEAEMTAASFTLNSQSCTGYQSSPAKGSLNPTTFSEGAKSWTVAAVCPITGATFFLQLDSGSSDVADLVDSNLEFHFGSTKFTGLTDGVNTSGMGVFQIPNSGLTPSAGTAYTLKFIRKQAPSAPRNLSATGVSATRIDLSWSAPEKTGGSDVTGYRIEVSNDGNTGWSELVADTESTDTSYSHKGLPPSATRHYRVSAINKVGAGPASASASGTTAAGFTPIANADGSLTLWEAEMTAASFTLNSQSCTGYQSSPAKGSLNPTTFSEGAKSWTVAAVCPITGATFFLQLDSGSSDVADLVDSNLEFHFGSTKFTGLTDSVNTSGMGVFQIPNSGLTPSAGTAYTLKFIRKQAPSAPRNLSAAVVSATRIDLSWSAPEKTGGSDVTGYKIEVSNDGNTGWSELVADTESTDTSYSHKGLPPSATRHYRVSAINKVGAGPASASASGTTAAGFTPIANADGSLTLWEAEMTAASFTLNSQSCTGYQSSPAKGSLNPTTFSEGAKSWTVAAVCPITGATFFLQLDSGSSDVADLVDSNLEFHFGSTKFTGLTDSVNTSGMGVFQIPSSGLTPSAGTAYTLKFIRKQAPSAPRNLRAKGVSATRIELSWTAPEKTGGSDVTGYKIEVSNDGSTGWTELVASHEVTTYTHMGLTANTMRYYRVSAINAVRTGSASGVALGNTEAPPPSFMPTENADGSLTLWEAGMTAASFTLNSQSCTGYQSNPAKGSLNPTTFSEGAKSWTVAAVCPINGSTFFLQLDSGSSDVADLVDSNLEFHFGSTKFTGLTDGVNTSGMGVFQIPSSGLTPSAGTAYTLKFIRKQAPSAPRNLRAKGVSATRIDLSWSAPEKTGGSDVTGYKIEVSNDGNTGWSELVASQTATTYSHTVTSGATRYYRVSAINAVGTGVASRVVSATAEDTAPSPQTAVVGTGGKAVTVHFDEAFPLPVPPGSAFTINIEGSTHVARRTSQTAGNHLSVRLPVDSPIRPGESVTISYTKPTTNPLQDAAGNETASFTNFPVTNALPPIAPDAPTNLHAKGVSTTRIDLSWDEPRYDGGAPIMGYTIEASADRGLTWTEIVASQPSIRYSHTVPSGVTRYYRVSAFNTAETSAPSRTASASAVDSAPQVIDAGARGILVELFFDEHLVESSMPAPSAFTVTVGPTSRTPRQVFIRNSAPPSLPLVALDLASDHAIKPGERVTVSYTKPSINPLKDAAGNETESFTNLRVVNVGETDFPAAVVLDEEAHESGDGTTTTMTFTVSVDKVPEFPVGVHYTTEDDTANGGTSCTGSSPPDYITTSGRVYFGPEELRHWVPSGARLAERSHEISVTICDDSDEDSDETFHLALRSTQLHEPIAALEGRVGPDGLSYGNQFTASATGKILNAETTTIVTIEPTADYAEEGADATFTLRRTGDADVALTVPVSVTEDGAALAAAVPENVTFAAESREATFKVPTEDDSTHEDDSTVTATIAGGFGWRVTEGATTATVTVLDNDEKPGTTLPSTQITIWSADMTVVEYSARGIGAGTADLLSNQQGSAGLQAKQLWYDPVERKIRIVFTTGVDDAEKLTLHMGDVAVGFPADSSGNASFTIEDVDVAWTDGETLSVRVSKASATAVSNDASLATLTTTGATLDPAFDTTILVYRAVADTNTETVSLSAIPTDSGAAVAYEPEEDGDTELAGHQVAVPDTGEALAAVTVTAANGTVRRYRIVIAGPANENTAPAGLPEVSGTPEVGETLTASVAGIADADGTDNAVFAYQWLAHDGTDDTAIAGATGATHEVAADDAGKTLTVRVTFTDDKGTEEVLVSAATDTVVDRRPVAATLSVGAGAAEAGRFRLSIAFGDAVTGLALADLAASRVGGDTAAVSELTEAETGRAWTAWVAAAAGRYTVRLPAGAAASGERRSLAAVLAVDVDASGNATAVAGPVVTSVSLAPADDGSWTDGDTVRLTLGFSEPVTVATAGGTPAVGIALDGSAREASYASGTGTATLAFAYAVTADDGTVTSVSLTADSLALNGGTIRDAGARDADLDHPGIGAATEETETESAAVLTGLKLVDTGTGTETALADGDALVLADPANGSWGLVAAVAAEAQVGSVRLVLKGANTVTAATDNAAPWSLHGDADGTVSGAGLPAGSYTLKATAHAEADGAGAALGTLSVSFSVAAGEAVAPDALTASFEGVPEAHGGPGSEAFTFRVRFSQEPRVSYAVLRDESFAVTGGGVRKARRVDGRNDLREIHVEPEGWDDVTVTLAGGRACGTEGAICTADNKVLANTAVATVPGPLALSVADAEAQEGPGVTLDFEVTLNRAASGTVTVDYATADGTATAGADYTAASGTLTFDPGETAKTVSVPVLDDAHDDDGETLTLTLLNASGARIRDGEATGTIENSDPIPQAWLARFGRTVADHVVDAVTERLTGSSGGGSQVTLGGQAIPLDGVLNGASARTSPGDSAGGDARESAAAADTLAAFAERISGNGAGTGRIGWGEGGAEDAAKGRETRGLSERELLLGSSFVLSLGGDGSEGMDTAWTAWGRAASSRFDGEAEGLVLDGDVTTFTFGADAARGRWLGGVALAHSTGEGGYRDRDDSGDPNHGSSGTLESSLTSVHPYARLAVSERLSLWGVLGYGTGDLTLAVDAAGDRPRQSWKTDTEMWMAAAGARGVLLSAADHGGFELAARGDARLVRMNSDAATGADGAGRLSESEAQTSRLRFILEGSHRIEFAGGQTLTPILEVGLRHDGGDAETGTGIELGGGVSYADPATGLTVTAKTRGLLAHEDADYTEWGASGSVKIDPRAAGRGLSLSLSHAWGAAEGGAERLWGLGDARGLAPEAQAQAGSRLEAGLGYGFAVLGDRGVATPYAGLSRSETGETFKLGQRLRLGRASEWRVEGAFGDDGRTYSVGYGYRLGEDLDLTLEASRREAANDDAPEHGIGFRLTARW